MKWLQTVDCIGLPDHPCVVQSEIGAFFYAMVQVSVWWCKSLWCKTGASFSPNLVQWCNSLTKSSEIITVDCSGATLSLHYGASLKLIHLVLVGWWYMSPIIMTRKRSWIDFELIVYSDAGLEFCTSGTTEWWVSFALLYFTAKSRNVYDITLQKFCHICVIYKITLYVHIMELLYSQFKEHYSIWNTWGCPKKDFTFLPQRCTLLDSFILEYYILLS